MKRLLQSAPARALFAWAIARYLVFVARTTHWHVENLPAADSAPLIVAFWHETLPAMPIFWLRWQPARPGAVLASHHRDGQLIGQSVRHMGIALISGSSSRGGAAGLRQMAVRLGEGSHIGLTPDGPRGPRRLCAPGIAQLAALSGCPILPCAAYITSAKTLATWDAMRIPRPFSRGALICGPLINVPRRQVEPAIPAIAEALTACLKRAAALA